MITHKQIVKLFAYSGKRCRNITTANDPTATELPITDRVAGGVAGKEI